MGPVLWSLILMFPYNIPYQKTDLELRLSDVFTSVSNLRMLSKMKKAIFRVI